ncbi:hypothetical protein HK102_014047 [Quaeritorhiza haematococci]|nr:hypothetical protein HK102_014047 [Quaeritorhiza haematococci]
MIALALSTLLSTKDPAVLSRLQGIMVVLSSVVIEVKGMDKEEGQVYWYEARDEHDDETSPDGDRRKEMSVRDPVQVLPLIPFVRQRLSEVMGVLNAGGEGGASVLGGIDPIIWKQMEEALA